MAYDASPQSRRALAEAARLLRPTHVEIITAWEPAHRQAATAASLGGLHQAEWSAAPEEEDAAYTEARAVCREGVALAEKLGLRTRAHLVECRTSVWSALVDAAAELRPDVIVTGTRSVGGLRALWHNSTAGSLIKNASIPVFIVPDPDEAAEEDAAGSAAETFTGAPEDEGTAGDREENPRSRNATNPPSPDC